MKIKHKCLLILAAVFAAALPLLLAGCGGTSQQGAEEIRTEITNLLAEKYNLTAEISTDEISSNYGYKDADDNDYKNYLGAVIWLEGSDDTISCENSKYIAADMAVYEASLPPYEEITRTVGDLLTAAGYGNYSVEFYHQLNIADGKTMANTATLLKLDDYENYSAINPIIDSLTPVEVPDEILNGEPLNVETITAFITDNYEFNVTAITCEGGGEDYQVTLELSENRGDLSAVSKWSKDDFNIWQMRVDSINYSIFEIYQFLNESHNVRADITVNVGGHKGGTDEYDPAAWFTGKYTTADPKQTGQLKCQYEDLATKAYNEVKGTDFPTTSDTTNQIF